MTSFAIPGGFSGNLTSNQSSAVSALREALLNFASDSGEASEVVSDEDPNPLAPIQPGSPYEEALEAKLLAASESDMLRFLRARQFAVQKATAMAINTCKWRASVKPQKITECMIPNALPSGCWRFAGHSRSGMPVIVIYASKWKPSDYQGIDEYVRYVAYFMEGAVLRMGVGVERVLIVFQNAGFTSDMMTPFATRCMKQLVSIVQDYYPERLGFCLISGSPTIFSAFWKIIKPMVDAVTYRKIQLVNLRIGSAKAIELIGEENLATCLGGKREEYPVPTRGVADEAATFLAGGAPPATDATALAGCIVFTAFSGATSGSHSVANVSIRAGARFMLQVSIEESTKSVSWNFRTTKHDIAFGYAVKLASLEDDTLETSEPETRVLQPPTRTPAFPDAVEGTLVIDESWVGGYAELVFDNSHSRMRSKTLFCTITVDAGC